MGYLSQSTGPSLQLLICLSQTWEKLITQSRIFLTKYYPHLEVPHGRGESCHYKNKMMSRNAYQHFSEVTQKPRNWSVLSALYTLMIKDILKG